MSEIDQARAAWRALRLEALSKDRFSPLWIRYDRHFTLQSIVGSPEYYGYANAIVGCDVRDVLTFLHGLARSEPIDFEFIETPNGRSIHVLMHRDGEEIECLLINASRERDQQQLLQQNSHELSLLTQKQTELLATLNQLNGELNEQVATTQRLNQLQAKFIATMSHEFRTPLASILAYANYLSEADPRIDLDSGLLSIDRAAKHLINLVDNLIDHSQFEINEIELNPTTIEVSNIVADMESMFRPMARSRGLSFNIEVEVGMPERVCIDETRFRQILINLLGNAFKYTERGSVTMSVDWRDDRFSIEIRDTGIGISSAGLGEVFQAFRRQAPSLATGVGLGLSITKRLVEFMRGEVRIESQLELGTTIHLKIPAQSVVERAGAPINLQHRETILVVEDDSDVYEILEIYLDDAGYLVVNADTAAAALDAVRSASPCAIIMDLNMPDMSGVELSRLLRDGIFDGPIIVLTASSLSRDRQSALAAGCSEYLVKPVHPPRLIEILSRHLQNSSGRAQ